MMNRALGYIAASIFLSTPAPAADLSAPIHVKAAPTPVVPFSWTGFYIGGHGGYGWGDSEEVFFNTPNDPTFIGTQTYNIGGALAGGVFGYHWQTGQFVIGAEVEGNWTDIKGTSGAINVGPPNIGDTYDTQVRWYGAVKGKLGLSVERSLLYATGGLAYGNIRHRYNGPPGDRFSRTENQTGWVVGAGWEYAFINNWAFKVEYNFVNLGDGSIQYSTTPTNRSEWDDQFHVIKAGINFRWGATQNIARY